MKSIAAWCVRFHWRRRWSGCASALDEAGRGRSRSSERFTQRTRRAQRRGTRGGLLRQGLLSLEELLGSRLEERRGRLCELCVLCVRYSGSGPHDPARKAVTARSAPERLAAGAGWQRFARTREARTDRRAGCTDSGARRTDMGRFTRTSKRAARTCGRRARTRGRLGDVRAGRLLVRVRESAVRALASRARFLVDLGPACAASGSRTFAA